MLVDHQEKLGHLEQRAKQDHKALQVVEAKKENVVSLGFWEIRDHLEREDFLGHLVLKVQRENWYVISFSCIITLSLLFDILS